MRIGSLKLSTIQGGAYHGATAFYLNMREMNKPKDVPKSQIMAEVVQMMQSMRLVNAGFVVVAGEDQNQDAEVLQLVRTVGEHNLGSIVYCTGESRPLFYDECKWKRVQRYSSRLDEEWMGFNTNEFEVVVEGALPAYEPALGKNNLGADRILTLSKKEKPQDVLQWIGEAQYPWRVTYPAIRDMEVVII